MYKFGFKLKEFTNFLQGMYLSHSSLCSTVAFFYLLPLFTLIAVYNTSRQQQAEDHKSGTHMQNRPEPEPTLPGPARPASAVSACLPARVRTLFTTPLTLTLSLTLSLPGRGIRLFAASVMYADFCTLISIPLS